MSQSTFKHKIMQQLEKYMHIITYTYYIAISNESNWGHRQTIFKLQVETKNNFNSWIIWLKCYMTTNMNLNFATKADKKEHNIRIRQKRSSLMQRCKKIRQHRPFSRQRCKRCQEECSYLSDIPQKNTVQSGSTKTHNHSFRMHMILHVHCTH